jgi:PAS domain S-box-containing protein
MSEIDILKRRIEREIKARKEAESLLETKSLELYQANIQLQKFNQRLAEEVKAQSTQMVQSEAKYVAMMENMNLAILEVDLNGNIQSANQRFCELSGYSLKELIGQNANDLLLDQEAQEIMRQHDSNRLEGEAEAYEIQLTGKDGKRRWVLISGAPIYDRDGRVSGSAGIHFDISYQKELQQELQRAREKAESAQKAEQQFLANMSHEIRTPLNAVIGMTHLLKDTELDKDQSRLVEIILHSSNLLLGLINDILDISKIDSGSLKLYPEVFDLNNLISKIQKTFEIKSREKSVDVLLHSELKEAVVKHDPVILNQVLMNLMGNAEKFTNDGQILLSALPVDESDQQIAIQFKVEDTGIGIEEADLENIFNKFTQVDKRKNSVNQGTGLGLSITKKLLQLMNSEIRVTSQPGKGSTFEFTIWFEKAGNEKLMEVIDSPEADYSNNDNRLLIVEDNEVNQRYLSLLLEKNKLHYVLAENGEEAINLVKSSRFDLILMDVQMPVMNGWEATRRIRSMDDYGQTPIIMMSAVKPDVGDKEYEELFTDFIHKPFTPIDFHQKISSYLTDFGKSAHADPERHAFRFDPQLDQNFLNTMYGDDLEYAHDIFETFLGQTPQMISQINDAMESNDLEKAKSTIHKMAPTLKMVGFSQLSEKLTHLDNNWPKTAKEVQEEWRTIEPLLANAIPVVQSESNRMSDHLSE